MSVDVLPRPRSGLCDAVELCSTWLHERGEGAPEVVTA